MKVFLKYRGLKIYELKQTARYSWLKKHMCIYTPFRQATENLPIFSNLNLHCAIGVHYENVKNSICFLSSACLISFLN